MPIRPTLWRRFTKLCANGICPAGRIDLRLGRRRRGRDKWKRPEMGKIAAENCDEIILTDEDPYDEDSGRILAEIKSGIQNASFPIQNAREIINREEAIEKAVGLAKAGDVVVITGKGSEPWMHLEKKRKIPWSDREAVLKALESKKPTD